MTYRQKWTKKYGNIPSGYSIHHLNFKHSDDRIQNLILLPSKFHSRFHFLAHQYKDNQQYLKEVLQKDKFINERYLNLMLEYNKSWTKEHIINTLIQNAPKKFLYYESN